MPELPEVETIRRGLEDKLIGRSISDIQIRTPKIFNGDPEVMLGRHILSLDRHGKLLVFLTDSDQALTIHLKMTGQLIWKPEVMEGEEAGKAEVDLDQLAVADNATLPDSPDHEYDDFDDGVVMGGHPEKAYLQPLPHKHTHVIFTFDDDSKLYFNDLRKFGKISVVPVDQLVELRFLQNLGPEPLQSGFTKEYLGDQLKKRGRTPVKSFLLDQGNMAGLGNIYADESLFRAAILPDRLAGSLTEGEVRNLFDAIQETLELALMHGGSSSRDYLTATGEKGTFLKIANVYHREGLDCNRCNTGKIQRKKIGGRSSHYCPVCQR